jgi:hypothetical protein
MKHQTLQKHHKEENERLMKERQQHLDAANNTDSPIEKARYNRKAAAAGKRAAKHKVAEAHYTGNAAFHAEKYKKLTGQHPDAAENEEVADNATPAGEQEESQKME